jgi:hypothetical protein
MKARTPKTMPTINPTSADLDVVELGANVPVDPGGDVLVAPEMTGVPLPPWEPEPPLESEGVPEPEVVLEELEPPEPSSPFALGPVDWEDIALVVTDAVLMDEGIPVTVAGPVF